MSTKSLTALTILLAAVRVAADVTLTGYAGANCEGAIIRQTTYSGGAGQFMLSQIAPQRRLKPGGPTLPGCHCDWGNTGKSSSCSGDSLVTVSPSQRVIRERMSLTSILLTVLRYERPGLLRLGFRFQHPRNLRRRRLSQ